MLAATAKTALQDHLCLIIVAMILFCIKGQMDAREKLVLIPGSGRIINADKIIKYVCET